MMRERSMQKGASMPPIDRKIPAQLETATFAYPDSGDFVDSTAAARVNGYLYGCGTFENLQAEVDSFGLSAAAKEKLLQLMRKTERRLKEVSAVS